jgi:hypothetical protein
MTDAATRFSSPTQARVAVDLLDSEPEFTADDLVQIETRAAFLVKKLVTNAICQNWIGTSDVKL